MDRPRRAPVGNVGGASGNFELNVFKPLIIHIVFRARGCSRMAPRVSAIVASPAAGLFQTVKITRMRRGQWNPAAAPKTAEGN